MLNKKCRISCGSAQQDTTLNYLRLKTTVLRRCLHFVRNLPMRKANAPTTLSDKVEKLRLKNNVLILARSPASIKSTYCTGRSSDLSRLSRLPSFHQWQRERQNKFRSSEWNSQQQALFGIYTRFPFHFSRRSVTQSSVCNDKDRKKFLDCTLWNKFFVARRQHCGQQMMKFESKSY